MTTNLWELMQHRKLLQMIFVLGVGGTFQAGFQVSMITFTSPYVKSFLNASWTERSGGLPLPSETLTLLWSLVVSIFALGGLLGSMASGYLAAKYGKKRCLLANNLAMLAGSLLLGLSWAAGSLEVMLVGRFLCGLCTGLSVPLHPQFLGEASPKILRGFANSTASAFWSLGKVFGQVMGQRMQNVGLQAGTMGSPIQTGGRKPISGCIRWHFGLYVPVMMGFAIQLRRILESPPHLFLHRGDEEGCRKAMRALWGEGRPWQQQQAMEDLWKEKQAQRSGDQRSLSVSDLVRERRLRAQLFLMVLISVAVQLSGIQAIYTYTFEVLSAAGFEDDQIPHLSLGLSAFELLSTLLCSVAIERFGRRVLMWGGYCVMATLLAGLTLTLSLQHLHPWVPYGSLCIIFAIVFSFGIGPAGATSSVRMEIFDQSSRASAFVVSGVLNWVGTFAIGMIFPFVVEGFGPFCFLLFGGVLYVSGFLVYLYLPETKEKSILEIQHEFDKVNFKLKKKESNFVASAAIAPGTSFCTKL